MATGDRSLSDVLRDIVRNIQDIIRSEVQLAKTEIRDKVEQAKPSARILGAGAVCALFAALFVLLSIFHALSLVMPQWTAALLIGVVLTAAASLLLSAGISGFKQLSPAPERTIETIKENVEWTKQHSK